MPDAITLTEDARNKLADIASELHDLQFPLMFIARAVEDQLDSPMSDGYNSLMDRLIEDLARLSDAVYAYTTPKNLMKDQPS